MVLGADTRATGGSIVCDLNCEKIHYIADNVFCCGAGTAADTEFTTKYVVNPNYPSPLSTSSLSDRVLSTVPIVVCRYL